MTIKQEGYMGNPNLKPTGVEVEYTKELDLEYGEYVDFNKEVTQGDDYKFYIDSSKLLEIAVYKKRVMKQIDELVGWEDE